MCTLELQITLNAALIVLKVESEALLISLSCCSHQDAIRTKTLDCDLMVKTRGRLKEGIEPISPIGFNHHF